MSEDIQLERVRHVNRYLTPLAALVVAPGLVFAQITHGMRLLAAALFVYALLLNYVSLRMISRGGSAGAIGKVRVVSNYATNIGLVCILYQSWPVVWVLLLMMSIGPAIYQSRKDTLGTATAVSVMLGALHWHYGSGAPGPWLETMVKMGAIILLGLFVNGLAHLPVEK